MKRAYFDHNATTPVCPEAAEAYARALSDFPGNPSSVHREGQAARRALEQAREDCAEVLGCSPKELVFTSGGTESDNLAVFGAAHGSRHVVTTAIEHPAVLNACAQLEREGTEVTYVKPGRDGRVQAAEIAGAIRPETALVSIQHANNETGVLQPVGRYETSALIHSDGVQAAGRIALNLRDMGVDLYSISGHKFHAPKGCGALYVRQGVKIQPMAFGGRHEGGRRAGTENVAGAVAMAAALRAARYMEGEMRDRLEAAVRAAVPDVTINGATAHRLPNTSSLTIEGVSGEAMVIALDLQGFAISSGSACSSGSVEPSHVLLAMGLAPERARASLRISLGPSNTPEQVDRLAEAIATAAAHLRRLSPAYA